MKTTPSQPGPRYAALIQLLRTADTLWNASRSFFERWDLGPSQFNTLNLLHDHPEGLTQVELSRYLVMHRSNITGLVDRLEKRGLVQRRDVPDDRRAYRITLTEAGLRTMEEILPAFHQAAEEIWGNMAVKRANELVAELKLVCERAEHIVAVAKR